MQSLSAFLEHYQYLRYIGEIVLISGLIVELIVIAYLDDDRVKKFERLGTLFSTAIIILGLIIETHAGGCADDVVRQMQASRALSSVQQKEISTKLEPFGAQNAVLFEASDVDPEIAGITVDISKALAGAGWTAGFDRYPPTPPMELRAPATGVLIVVSTGAPDKRVLSAANVLVDSLRANGIIADLSTGWVGPYPPVDNRVKIVVYTKGNDCMNCVRCSWWRL
jgi:hypothetical protein